MSLVRKQYFIRLIFRIIVFIFCFIMSFKTNFLNILEGMNFFKGLHILHVLWIIWVFDIVLQIIPIKNKTALGSQKLFKNRFLPIRGKMKYKSLKNYIKNTTISAYKIFIIWGLLVLVIGLCYYFKIIDKTWLFMLTVFFYVCDLICVLVWCPFRLIMKNKCCTTCRIFNWDHIMMFSPLIFCGGFFAISLIFLSIVAWLVWELCVLIYPERFSEMTNVALRCINCTDKLCTQYCKKLR